MGTPPSLALALVLMWAWPAQADQTVLGHVTVTTPLGQLKGSKVSVNGQPVLQFLSVPYAKPPLGHLRFAKPEPVEPWSGVRDATSYGPSCQQTTSTTTLAQLPNKDLSEDCLHLNVYVPRDLPNPSGSHDHRPVMVWLHGGGYVTQQASRTDGSLLALHGHVIVVTVEYRLDVFGFLFSRNSSSPGNQGLWDQIEALRWVQSNIAAFGGNPNRVTLFGRSAGAYSTGLLALSPLANGLFRRIILQSDVAIGPRALFYDPDHYNKRMSTELHCPDPDTDPTAFVHCLRQKPVSSLLHASSLIMNAHKLSYAMPMGPVVDGDLFPTPIMQLMQGGGTGDVSDEAVGLPDIRDIIAGFNDADGGIFVSGLTAYQEDLGFNISEVPYRHLEVMAGFNNAEGGLFVSRLKAFETDFNFHMKTGIPTRVLCDHIAPVLASEYYKGSSAVSSAICKEYSRHTTTTAYTQGRAVADLFSDFVFFAPTIHSLLTHHSLQSGLPSPNKAFLYQFSHQPSASTMPSRVPWFHRASHGDEELFVFGTNAHIKMASAEETTLSSTIMTYWTNFAKYGDPNGPDGSAITWPQFEPINRPYMNLDVNGTSVNYDPYRARMDFWLHTLPSLAHTPPGSSLFG